MPKLIILRGNSASGKSTVAARLQHIIGSRLIVMQVCSVVEKIGNLKQMKTVDKNT